MLKIIDFEHRTEWDRIVLSFPNYDIYYLSGYLAPFEVHGDGKPILIYYEGEEIRAICVFMLRDISNETWAQGYIDKGTFFDAITPYGYGGWILDGNTSKEKIDIFWKEVETFMHNQKIINTFTRWSPWLKNQEYLRGWSNVIDLGNTIYIDCTSEEGIFQNIKSKDRATIRKAIKNGVVVKHSDDTALFEKFYSIYNATMDKDNADDYYYFKPKFYKSMSENLQGQWEFFYAILGEEIIAMSIMLMCNGRMHYHLSGSVMEFRNLNATNLILYEAAKYGAQHGYKLLHLGGGVGSGEDPLYKFKKAFNKNGDIGFSISKDCYDINKYSYLIELRKKIDPSFDVSTSFFPAYRSK
jgi:hypothetical protein